MFLEQRKKATPKNGMALGCLQSNMFQAQAGLAFKANLPCKDLQTTPCHTMLAGESGPPASIVK